MREKILLFCPADLNEGSHFQADLRFKLIYSLSVNNFELKIL